jgi:hypothetical protein
MMQGEFALHSKFYNSINIAVINPQAVIGAW